MAEQLQHYRFSVEEYHRMGEAGIFDEDSRVELIGGQIIVMRPIGDPHIDCVNNYMIYSPVSPAKVGLGASRIRFASPSIANLSQTSPSSGVATEVERQ